MPELNPKNASELAQTIYTVINERRAAAFLAHNVFSEGRSNTASHKYLKAEVGGRIVLNKKTGFGICAKGGGTFKNDLFLIFRGTDVANSKADLLTDARIGITSNQNGLPVHCGFHHCFTSMLPEIEKFFASSKGIQTVHCIGHSLGGAVASLAADWIKRKFGLATKLYTFGAPRVGTDWFVKSTTSLLGAENIHRAYHRTDPVPMIPLYPFTHAPSNAIGHYLPSTHPLLSHGAHDMEVYKKSVKDRTWMQLCESPGRLCTIETHLEGWLRSKSRLSKDSPRFWHWVESAIVYVIKKISIAAALALNGTLSALSTVADKIAYILKTGLDRLDEVSDWVVLLMRKIMQGLGMQTVDSKKQLTQDFMRQVLNRLEKQAYQHAEKAIERN